RAMARSASAVTAAFNPFGWSSRSIGDTACACVPPSLPRPPARRCEAGPCAPHVLNRRTGRVLVPCAVCGALCLRCARPEMPPPLSAVVAAPSSNAGRAGFWCPAPGVECALFGGGVGGASGVTLPQPSAGRCPHDCVPGPGDLCAIATGTWATQSAGTPLHRPLPPPQRPAVGVPCGPKPGVRGVGFTVSATARPSRARPAGRGRAGVSPQGTSACTPGESVSDPHARAPRRSPQSGPDPRNRHCVAASTTTQPVRLWGHLLGAPPGRRLGEVAGGGTGTPGRRGGTVLAQQGRCTGRGSGTELAQQGQPGVVSRRTETASPDAIGCRSPGQARSR
ncbi:MAG: hypothetical protein JWL99_435, partial [Streptomyces oryziradicis]|nr:hypothetical protein [Actinacidiphila oryziradicis]